VVGLRLVTWNCNGAYRRKAQPVARYKPDLAVIQECESLERLKFVKEIPSPSAGVWFGDNLNRGVGVFSYTGLEFELYQPYHESIKYCVPIKVRGRFNFNLLAIWAMGHQDRQLSYIGQVFQALEVYRDFIKQAGTILIGDFNSNKIWDRKSRIGNHSRIVDDLEKEEIVSVYHTYFSEAQGVETQPTFYLYRNQDKAYHIDYCFVPKNWTSRLSSVSVGTYAEWRLLSDHSPIFIEFENEEDYHE
jgi:exonuclease III